MKYLFLVIIAITLFSCKKQEVETYSGGDGVNFYVTTYEPDSISYSFAFSVLPKQRDTVFFKMRVLGAASDKPRTISVKAGAGTTARKGIDYELPDMILPAGQLTVLYPIVLLNSPEMLNKTFRLVAEVAESKDLVSGATGTEIGGTITLKNVRVDITNQIVKPTYWPSIEGAFGLFSVTKFKFMIQVTGLTDFSEEAIGIDGYYNLPVKLRNALAEYEAINGPLINESGNRVTF
jgi:hypothetical protein